MKATDEKSRIRIGWLEVPDLRIRIRNKMSRIGNTKKIDFYKRELLNEEAWARIRIRTQNIAFYAISACIIFNVVPNLQ
jgi:hypothetical protein